jgi:hypothetical protein
MGHKKFGWEGQVAFMSLCEGETEHYDEPPEPLEEYFTRKLMDKDKYEAARAWLKEIKCDCWHSRGISDVKHFDTKECLFGWKIHRPMYVPAKEGKGVEKYW